MMIRPEGNCETVKKNVGKMASQFVLWVLKCLRSGEDTSLMGGGWVEGRFLLEKIKD